MDNYRNNLKKLNETTLGLTKVHPHGNVELEVGDAKQPDFHPRVKIKRWDNEVNFSVGLVTDHATGKHTLGADGVTWSNHEYDAKFYELHPHIRDLKDGTRPRPFMEDGGFEFEFTLRQKPSKNTIDLSIQTKALEFLYQPFLTPQEKLEHPNSRKINVEGSYAVYHAEKSGDHTALGGKNYAAGKAFHIYRPHAVDAKGREVWGNLSIDEKAGLLTIILPQAFLDTATYPVWVDPTIGYATKGASAGTNFSSSATQTASLTGGWTTLVSGNVSSISMYVYRPASGTVEASFSQAVYNGATVEPGSASLIVAGSNETTAGAFDGWWTSTVTSTALDPSKYNYLASLWFNGGKTNPPAYYYDSWGSNDPRGGPDNTNAAASTFPSSIPSITQTGIKTSQYFTYGTGGGGSVITSTQSATARIAKKPTKTQLSHARIAKNYSRSQAATANISAGSIYTAPQTATARTAVTKQTSQSAIARIVKNVAGSRTQPSIARIAAHKSRTQPTVARIAANFPRSQSATARIVTNTAGSKVQTGIARIASGLTTTQPAVARIASYYQSSQSATAHILTSAVDTTSQSAVARIASNRAKTQVTIARVAITANKPQSTTARLANTRTKTQPAVARIITDTTRTATQPALGRIATIRTATQPTVARLAKNLAKIQTSTARTATIGSKTESAVARIAQAHLKTQPAGARVAIKGAKPQTSVARIKKTVTRTQITKARLAQTYQRTQASSAHITAAVTTSQPTISRIAINRTTTQPSTARIILSTVPIKNQAALARIAITSTKAQPVTARIIVNVVRTKTQPSIARLSATKVRTQPSKGRLSQTKALTQPAVAHLSITGRNAQGATAHILADVIGHATQPARARLAAHLVATQPATAHIYQTHLGIVTQAATAHISQRYAANQPATASIAVNDKVSEPIILDVIERTAVIDFTDVVEDITLGTDGSIDLGVSVVREEITLGSEYELTII
jgi:hypothetical protein